MKRHDYSTARNLNIITGVVFFSQFASEVNGFIIRKPGFEWVVYACGGAFLLSIIYSMVLILLNVKNEHDKEIGRTQKTRYR